MAMTSSNPLPDEVREEIIKALRGGGRIASPGETINAIAPILLKYQAKVDAEIVISDPRTTGRGPLITAAAKILAQFTEVPNTTGDHHA